MEGIGSPGITGRVEETKEQGEEKSNVLGLMDFNPDITFDIKTSRSEDPVCLTANKPKHRSNIITNSTETLKTVHIKKKKIFKRKHKGGVIETVVNLELSKANLLYDTEIKGMVLCDQLWCNK